MTKGLTLIEALIVISILAIITGLLSANFLAFQNKGDLEGTNRQVVTDLRQMQSAAWSSLDDKSWGVHLESDFYVLFSGDTYNSADTQNKRRNLPSNIKIQNISLQNSVADILFLKRTGKTDNFGSFQVATQGNAKTVSISKIGQINVQ